MSYSAKCVRINNWLLFSALLEFCLDVDNGLLIVNYPLFPVIPNIGLLVYNKTS